MAIHLNDIIKSDGSLKRFEPGNVKKKSRKTEPAETAMTSIGLFFIGEKSLCKNKTKKNAAKKNYEELIFEKAKKILQTDQHKTMLPNFTIHMVTVANDGNDPIASILCVYCKEKRQLYFDKTYFVLSNFKKHLDLCAKLNRKDVCDDEVGDKKAEENHQEISEEKLIDMEISPLNSNERFIHSQISEQMHRMALVKCDRTANYTLKEKQNSSIIDAALIPANGDCLLGCIVHQLFCHQVKSDEYNSAVEMLRQDAVSFIKNNVEDFKDVITNSDHFAKKAKGTNLEERIENFIQQLEKPGFWCGTETMIAISRLKSINIITCLDNGSSSMTQPFNFNAKSCAILVFCRYETLVKLDDLENHYNSVVNMTHAGINTCMRNIVRSLTVETIELE